MIPEHKRRALVGDEPGKRRVMALDQLMQQGLFGKVPCVSSWVPHSSE
jgi:hypothetical protein